MTPIATVDTGARNVAVLAGITTVVGLAFWPLLTFALPASLIGTFVTWRSRRLYRNVCLTSAMVCLGVTAAAYSYWRATTGG